ncbi:MAG TPA: response regulator transcription factor [Candidatus Dormibacteraeota bacterium]|nr:response regulator transcription factor [Candidatus Dormibacteraeota bacterium]
MTDAEGAVDRGFGRRAGERPQRVLVVDDHRIVAEAMAIAIDAQPDMECVGTAGTAAEARRLAASLMPDTVLTDIRLPDGDGLDVAADIRAMRPEVRVLAVTAHTDAGVLARAAAVGVCGFLPKEAGVAEVIRAVRTSRDGGMVVDGSTLTSVLARVRQQHAQQSARSPLTPREEEVLRAMGSGLDPQTIAGRLNMSVHTCRGHVKSILGKLGAHSQLEAVVIAVRRGLLSELTETP